VFKGTLLPYQPEAVEKMCTDGKTLVAYDLGLGKTVLTIAALERLRADGSIEGPGMIICLSALKYQWYNQIKKFTDDVSVVVLDGSPTKRAQQYMDAINGKYDYVIMNYEQIVNDWKFVQKLPREFVVLDEATAIKSFRSKRSKHVKQLANAKYKFALTGTPIENGKPEELYSIMQFVDNQLLGNFEKFDNAFIVRNHWGGVSRYRNLPILHKKLMERCVRKSQKDADVAPFLPDSIHKDPMFSTLDRKSAKLYSRIVNDLLVDLEEGEALYGSSFNILAHYGLENSWSDAENELRGKLMSKIGALKMLCSHPDLLRISAEKFHKQEGDGSAYIAELVDNGHLDDITKCEKLDMLVSYVNEFLDISDINKVVIFATHVDMLDIIQTRLGKERCRLYSGKLNAKQKEDNKVAFNSDPSIRVLISSDAGGYGVDLPAGNLLINYDLPWSSGTAVQRNGRIVRASSNHTTAVVVDFLYSGSLEVRQYDALQQKGAVAAAVVDGKGIDSKGGVELTLASLSNFLRNTTI
jgi:SNF2 family DNA or RNA helicase